MSFYRNVVCKNVSCYVMWALRGRLHTPLHYFENFFDKFSYQKMNFYIGPVDFPGLT